MHDTRGCRRRASAGAFALARGAELAYDRLILSPGIDFFFDRVDGLGTRGRARGVSARVAAPARRRSRCAGSSRRCATAACSRSRFPARRIAVRPAPYERACQVAWYFKRAKPRSKVLILDGNEDVQSKKALFTKAWNEDYKGIVEYRPNHVLTDVDVRDA